MLGFLEELKEEVERGQVLSSQVQSNHSKKFKAEKHV